MRLLLQQHRNTLAALPFIPHNIIHLVPQPPLGCEPHGCRWRAPAPTTPADFHAYAATIIIILLCALICALVLHGAIRCFLRNNRAALSFPAQPQLQLHHHPKTASQAVPVALAAAPMRVFVPGMKLAGAEAECAICLTEFVAGEEIRVLETCQHGFHVPCVEKWLCSHSSCPICRSSCIPPTSEASKPETGAENHHGDPPESRHSV